MMEYMKIADIGEEGKAKVRRLEETLGAHIMAYDYGFRLAKLTPEQLQEVNEIEQELGVILLAYEE